MGLTVAEAFMLISFVLLMILALWRAEYDERGEAIAPLTAADVKAIARELTGKERQALVHLVQRESDVRDILARERKADSGEAAIVSRVRLDETEQRARLVEDEEIRQLAEAVIALEPGRRQLVTDLVKVDDFATTIERLAAINDMLGERSVEEIAEALALAKEMQSIRATVGDRPAAAIAEAVSLADSAQDEGGTLEDRIRDRLTAIEEAKGFLVSDLDIELGEAVRSAGGRIDETGAVVLPDDLLFEAGSARLASKMTAFLSGFCQPWLETVRRVGLDVDEIRIEGHASSEWIGASSESEAFVRNLDLSQRRAQAVLERCTDVVRDPALEAWARRHLTAVGYSSSRPVEVDGVEDAARSRRVVFEVALDRGRVFSGIESELGPTGVLSLQGEASVIDGDTIEIDGRNLRLSGIDAPESRQTCERRNGAWPCGKVAAEALADLVKERPVRCVSEETDRYGRPLVSCTAGDRDVAEWMVAQGLAWASRKYSSKYLRAEAGARSRKLNIWSGRGEPPWEWRKNQRMASR